MVVKKLGHPVPLSYFIAEVNSARSQPAQRNTPGRFSLFKELVNGRSVASRRSTSNASGWVSFSRQACLLSVSLSSADTVSKPAGR